MSKPQYTVKVLTRDECDVQINELQNKIMALLDDELIDPHKQGKLDAGSVVYIATSALCTVTAFSMLGQMEDLSSAPRLVEAYIKMFQSKVESLLDWRNKQDETVVKQ